MARRNEVAIILTALDAASRTLDGVRQSVNDLDTTGSRAERGGVAGIGRGLGGLINPATLAARAIAGLGVAITTAVNTAARGSSPQS